MSEKQEPFQQIYGTEMEWPMSVKDVGSRNFYQLNLDPIRSSFIENYLPEGVISISNFLSNGARYYKDIGGKVEYATPEDTSNMSVFISELAGEWIAAEGLRRYIAETDHIAAGYMSKRVVDNRGETWGYHINNSEDRTKIKDLRADTRAVITHLATSLPMIGGGAVYFDKLTQQYRYSFGQKVLAPINADYSGGTTVNNKPLINERDEPHANSAKYRRIHIVGVDPHVSPWAGWMATGTIGLMLAASRQGLTKGMRLGGLPDPGARVSAIAALDLEMSQKYEMESGKSYTALEIQEKLIGVADKLKDLTVEQVAILNEWKYAHGILQTEPYSLTESDAIAKYELVQADMRRRGKQVLDAASMGVDLAYTIVFKATKQEAQELTTDQILAKNLPGKLRQGILGKMMPAPAIIHDAIHCPPETTRAYGRGQAIREGKVSNVGWSGYRPAGMIHNLNIQEPLDDSCPEAERQYRRVIFND